MPIKLELVGETIAEFTAELEALIMVIRPLAQASAEPATVELPATAPDEARTTVDEHFDGEDYEAATARREPTPVKSGKPKKVGRPPLMTVEKALKSLKQNGAEPEPALRCCPGVAPTQLERFN